MDDPCPIQASTHPSYSVRQLGNISSSWVSRILSTFQAPSAPRHAYPSSSIVPIPNVNMLRSAVLPMPRYISVVYHDGRTLVEMALVAFRYRFCLGSDGAGPISDLT